MKRLVIERTLQPGQYWREAWAFRQLAYNLAWRDISIRYKQTVLGLLWAVIRPLAFMGVLTAVFSLFAKLDGGGVAYPLVVLSGLLCWQFAAAIIGAVSACIIGNGNLVGKIYFPRVLLPAGSTLSTLVDLAISLAIMLALMLAFGVWPTWRLVTLPLCVLLALALAGGVGLYLAAFAVRYRDVLHVVPVAVQLSMYLSPVGYLTTNVPEKYQTLYALNPLVGVIGGFRWALLGESFPIDWFAMSISCATAAVAMTVGLITFMRGEHRFADEL